MLFAKSDGHSNDNSTDTSVFWIGLRHIEQNNLPGDEREEEKE